MAPSKPEQSKTDKLTQTKEPGTRRRQTHLETGKTDRIRGNKQHDQTLLASDRLPPFEPRIWDEPHVALHGVAACAQVSKWRSSEQKETWIRIETCFGVQGTAGLKTVLALGSICKGFILGA